VDDEFSIETPEAVRFGYDIAGIGSRFLAALVDTLIIVILQALVLGLTLAVLAGTLGDLRGGGVGTWIAAGLGLLAFALLWGYYLLFEMIWNGQSPGKRWVGLRVIKDNGAPISFVDSVIRNLVRLVDFLPAYYGIGVVVMFLNDQARRLGDFAAGTLVIRERKGVALDSLIVLSRPAAPALLAEPLPGLESLAAGDYDLIERFLQRRDGLANRERLACKLAANISARMGLAPQELAPLAAEEFLLHVANAYRQHHRSSGR
jgi:uncharacterized RDD family membrane protein YckC